MAKVKTHITFEFDLETLKEENPEMNEEQLTNYLKTCMVEDVENFVKYNELYDAIQVEMEN